ncbi:MAG: hypothetical protein AVO33_08660 [delta proteobacterium ML8_F1]|nr:MAG: hypothetical protein AVO33_08660 [delta proteobacterium ML8_F1]
MGIIDKRLEELNIILPEVPRPMANYVSIQSDGPVLYLSGSGPIVEGKVLYQGILGKDLTVQEGYEAAKLAVINHISLLRHYLGDLDRVEQIVKLLGFVASEREFYEQPQVINGASDLLVAVFGEAGKHARSAIGTSVLPMNIPVEIELVVRVRA